MKNQRVLPLSICLVLSFIAGSAESASFNCSKATTKIEKSICNNPMLSELDEAMARSFKQARLASKNSPEFKKLARDLLKERNKCEDDSCLEQWMKSTISKYDEIAGYQVPVKTAIEAKETPTEAEAPVSEEVKSIDSGYFTHKAVPGRNLPGDLQFGVTTLGTATDLLKKKGLYDPAATVEIEELEDPRLAKDYGKIALLSTRSLIGDMATKSDLSFLGNRLIQLGHFIPLEKWKDTVRPNLEKKYGPAYCRKQGQISEEKKKQVEQEMNKLREVLPLQTGAKWTKGDEAALQMLKQDAIRKASPCISWAWQEGLVSAELKGPYVYLSYVDDGLLVQLVKDQEQLKKADEEKIKEQEAAREKKIQDQL